MTDDRQTDRHEISSHTEGRPEIGRKQSGRQTESRHEKDGLPCSGLLSAIVAPQAADVNGVVSFDARWQ